MKLFLFLLIVVVILTALSSAAKLPEIRRSRNRNVSNNIFTASASALISESVDAVRTANKKLQHQLSKSAKSECQAPLVVTASASPYPGAVTSSGAISQVNNAIKKTYPFRLADKALYSLQTNSNTPVLLAAFLVAALMYPLDLIRALKMANAASASGGDGAGAGAASAGTYQLLSGFIAAHGVKGLLTQGLLAELSRSTWMRFIKYATFPLVHTLVSGGLSETQGTMWTKMISAVITSVPEVILIMPLEIAKIALQLDTFNVLQNSIVTAMYTVYKQQGLQGLFLPGYLGIQFRNTLFGSAYFVSVDFFKRNVTTLLQSHFLLGAGSHLALVLGALIGGFFAGVFGTCFNTPFDAIRSTIQKRVLGDLLNPTDSAAGAAAAAATGPILATDLLSVGREIYLAKGMSQGLYAGFFFKAVHLGMGSALMSLFIPLFKRMLCKKAATPSPPTPFSTTTSASAAASAASSSVGRVTSAAGLLALTRRHRGGRTHIVRPDCSVGTKLKGDSSSSSCCCCSNSSSSSSGVVVCGGGDRSSAPSVSACALHNIYCCSICNM